MSSCFRILRLRWRLHLLLHIWRQTWCLPLHGPQWFHAHAGVLSRSGLDFRQRWRRFSHLFYYHIDKDVYFGIHQRNVYSKRFVSPLCISVCVRVKGLGMHGACSYQSQSSGVTCGGQSPTATPYHSSLYDGILYSKRLQILFICNNLIICLFANVPITMWDIIQPISTLTNCSLYKTTNFYWMFRRK